MAIEKRNIGYLPQDYGLFPHMNVEENISFGPRVRGAPRSACEKSVQQLLELVDLRGFEKRKVNQLSGGQKQRVGLARALATKPRLLLLDEPLSNIDQVTKQEVAIQLKQLFASLDIPIILVTHQHEEALFFGQKLAIILDGRIEQMGSAEELLSTPRSPFVRKLLRPFTDMTT
jgi:ABC-type Fe3+/spermidine/putrescine transport system ATPase subunit